MNRRPKMARPRPVIRTRTEAQSAADMQAKAKAARSAAVTVTDQAITAGCAGADCTAGHAGHVDGIVQALQILGLMPDPQAGAKSKAYHWGAPKGDRA